MAVSMRNVSLFDQRSCVVEIDQLEDKSAAKQGFPTSHSEYVSKTLLDRDCCLIISP